MGDIPQGKIDRANSNIFDAITEFVKLEKRGFNYFGLCPFHNEKSPSFSVRADKGFYYCFGCGASGDSISFMMELQG